jgi:hypothetical protein
MPLLLGKNIINEIKGPFTMNVLRPNAPGATMILFGESHTLDHYEPCKSDNCISMINNFVPMLNEFASTYPTELYTEAFFSDYKHTSSPFNKSTETIIDTSIQGLHDFRRPINPIKLRGINIPESTLDEFNNLYLYCFHPTYKHKCEYKNISWNYADVRFSNVYGFDTMSKSASHYSRLINTLKNIKFRPEDDDDIPFDIDKDVLLEIRDDVESEMSREYTNKQDFSLPDYLRRLVFINNDASFFIDRLFETDRIKSQYDKLSDELKQVFTKESFIDLSTYWRKSDIEERDYIGFDIEYNHKYSVLLELLISFYTTKDETNMDEIATTINKHLDDYDEQEFEFTKLAPLAFTSCALDIYFILRSNKRIKENKLIVGYFGRAHTDIITTYYTKIIKTHTLIASKIGEGVINIPDDIDLTHLHSIHAGTRKRGKKKSVKRVKKVST